jgi:hypothetical protein
LTSSFAWPLARGCDASQIFVPFAAPSSLLAASLPWLPLKQAPAPAWPMLGGWATSHLFSHQHSASSPAAAAAAAATAAAAAAGGLHMRPPPQPSPGPTLAAASPMHGAAGAAAAAEEEEEEEEGGEVEGEEVDDSDERDGRARLAVANTGPHACGRCGRRFKRRSALIIHQRIHSGDRPFACPFAGCGLRFSDGSNFRRHRLLHEGGDVFFCSLCGGRFSRKQGLLRHLRSGSCPAHKAVARAADASQSA